MWLITALIPLFLAAFVGVRASSLTGRDTTDICGNVNTELVVPDPLGILTAVGVINSCICQAGIPEFLQTNVVGALAVTIAGEDVVQPILLQLIASFGQTCHYPDHAIPICDASNPCSFTCDNGFTESPATNPTSCVCDSHNTICNGVCTPSQNCPSGTPAKRALRRRDKKCKKGFAACGVFGGTASQWECVNTMSDLENCGGCALRISPSTRFGTDCSALDGVSDVSCLKGTCVVGRCAAGYKVSKDNSSCIPSAMVVES